jgi:hypothetical protein
MKRDFTHENFEHFLKQSADNLRMKAPDKVWENLSRRLNKRRKRFAVGISTFLLITSAVGYYTISNISQAHLTSQEKSSPTSNSANIDREPGQKTTSSITNQPKADLTQPQTNKTLANAPVATNRILAPVFRINGELLHPAETDNTFADELFAGSDFLPTIVDSYTEFDQQKTPSRLEKSDEKVTHALPLTIESVINSYKTKNKKNRIETQLYFAPTISYRKLTENKSYLRGLDAATIPPNFPALYSTVNSNVTHKPDVGFEIGFAAKYPVSNKLKIRSGLQFNVNRYDVKAFSSPLSVATIALNNGARIDSLSTISGYSNIQGYKSNWLQNFSFQVSVPVGVEYTLSSSDKMQFGVASSIQPTYVLGDRAYLITTDYKSYTQVPWLIRRWNVNTSLETFVSYTSGKTKWQIGPQVRYQLLSSFISKYPVKENLFDFGLKVGVTLNK